MGYRMWEYLLGGQVFFFWGEDYKSEVVVVKGWGVGGDGGSFR